MIGASPFPPSGPSADAVDGAPVGAVLVSFNFVDPVAAVKRTDSRWSVTGYRATFDAVELLELGGDWEQVAQRDGS